jgi:HK97 family phage major capsid protein
MPLGTTTAAGILSAEEVANLIVQPLRLKSVALRTTTVLETIRPSVRFPVVVTDASAELVDEGAEIDETDADIAELNVVPVAFKALTRCSNELIADSAVNAQAAAVIGDGLVRSFARALDLAPYGNVTNLSPSGTAGIHGLESLGGIQTIDVGGPLDSLDPFIDAISLIERFGSVCTSFAASFSTVNALSKIKKFQDSATVLSNEPILAVGEGDVSQPVSRSVFGVPVYSVPEGCIADGDVWAIASDKTFSVMRSDLSIQANPYSAFSSDSTQIRGVMRVNFGFCHEATIVKIVSAVPGS